MYDWRTYSVLTDVESYKESLKKFSSPDSGEGLLKVEN